MYSRRLSWSFFPNAFSQAVAELKRNGTPLLDLTISNPTEALEDYPHADIRTAFAGVPDFTYHPDPFGKMEAREVVAEYYSVKGVHVRPDQVILTASTSEAYGILFKLLCDPGDDVLVPTPSYPLFEYLAALESVRITPFRLRYDGHWYLETAALVEQVTSRTRAIVVVNPNNPTGSFLKRDEWRKLCEFASERGLAIISDEVFTDYFFADDGARVETFIGSENVLSFSLNGLSKCAGMPQMKLGWIVAAEADRKLELISDTYLSVNTPVQNALPDLLNIGRGIRSKLRAVTQTNLRALKTLLDHSAAQALRVEGGWSAIVRVPGVQSEETWILKLLEEYRVVVQPGYFFDMASEAYLVLSLITPPEVFERGVKAIRELTLSLTRL